MTSTDTACIQNDRQFQEFIHLLCPINITDNLHDVQHLLAQINSTWQHMNTIEYVQQTQRVSFDIQHMHDLSC
jgi:hypothetical protein